MMIKVEELFGESIKSKSHSLKKMDSSPVIGIYYGITEDGHYRIAFMSKKKALKMQGTQLLDVLQLQESEDVFWTYITLLERDASKIFFAFCDSLINSVSKCSNERIALLTLADRYVTWKDLFKNKRDKLSREQIQGLFGELYFLHVVLKEKVGVEKAIYSWSGPEATSKDFSLKKIWYEIKTVGALSEKVKISSLSQLSDELPGQLVIFRVEKMSDEFENGLSSVSELFDKVRADIGENPELERIFMLKLGVFEVALSDECFRKKFSVKDVSYYNVDDSFPRLTEKDINKPEINDVKYSLNISMLEKYKIGG
ncbi:MAG: PD-(D/E)XK motif protein [Phascolarctobacterium sp.]|nr:PD-(D/E)XK motif protein [Candidatus Phascolarctobacterium caballi]